MPYASPVENAIALSQAVLHTDKAREMVANYELSSMDVDVELPDYGNLKKPLLEAFTLDSTACAACTYMWGVAQDAKKHFGDRIDVVEYMSINFELQLIDIFCIKINLQKNTPAVTLKKSGYYRVSLDVAG